jgi:hypothetical protein
MIKLIITFIKKHVALVCMVRYTIEGLRLLCFVCLFFPFGLIRRETFSYLISPCCNTVKV